MSVNTQVQKIQYSSGNVSFNNREVEFRIKKDGSIEARVYSYKLNHAQECYIDTSYLITLDESRIKFIEGNTSLHNPVVAKEPVQVSDMQAQEKIKFFGRINGLRVEDEKFDKEMKLVSIILRP